MGSHRWLQTPHPRFSKDLLESFTTGHCISNGFEVHLDEARLLQCPRRRELPSGVPDTR